MSRRTDYLHGAIANDIKVALDSRDLGGLDSGDAVRQHALRWRRLADPCQLGRRHEEA